MDATIRYEAFAEWFYLCHGMMAPGKSRPWEGEPCEVVAPRWDAFCSMLGPSDRACLVGLFLAKSI